MSTIRVLHILHSMNRGGAENAIMNYYRHIDRDRVQFDFLLTKQTKNHFEDEILSLGGRIYKIPLLTLKDPFPYLRAVRLFFQEHPEYSIVHSHTSSKSFIPLFYAKRKGVPVRICHSHNTKSERGYKGIIRNLLKIPLRHVATHLFSCGEEAAEWLYGKNLVKQGKVTILPNVIECDRFDYDIEKRRMIRESLGISESTVLIGNAARFSRQKNHSFLLEIFKQIKQIVPESFLLLAGDGELRDQLIKQITDSHLENSVILLGVVPNVNEYEQAMDAFVMPSYYEGLPLSLIEAQVSGLKCFVSEGVPREADKTGLVSFIPLSKGSEYWAEVIIKNIGYKRESRIEDIRRAGYDANLSAQRLESFYLNNHKAYYEQ